MVKDYKIVEQDEKKVGFMEDDNQVQPVDSQGAKQNHDEGEVEVHAAGDVATNVTENPNGMATKKEMRGAGIGGGLVGLCLGGPVLAIVGGVVAAKVAKSDSKAGQFCRRNGNKVANVVIRGCDYVKDKMQPKEMEDNRKEEEDAMAKPPVQAMPIAVA